MPQRHFASDNWAGVHPKVLRALAAANAGHAPAYGGDPWTARAEALFHRQFGRGTQAFLVFNGTAANVLALSSMAPFESTFTAASAHLQVDECGAPERFLGGKLIPLPAHDGKIRLADLEARFRDLRPPHSARPRAVSITQPTELGTLYTPREIRALARFCRRRNLFLHMDGARISNAAAAQGLTLKAASRDLGVDVLSFGGTKIGLLAAEAVLFFTPRLAEDFAFRRKQGMQLASKSRFLGAQFVALLSDGLWRRNALHANRMARRLAAGLRRLPGVRITRPVETNAVFAVLPPRLRATLQRRASFHVWDSATGECRLMTSWDTTPADLDHLFAL